MFTGVKSFHATMKAERDALGDKVTSWIRENPHLEIVDKTVSQSSDESFHCISIVIFYKEGRPR